MNDQHLGNAIFALAREQRLSRRWRLFFRFSWLLIAVSAIYYFSHINHTTGKTVGVVNLNDVISSDNQTYQNVANALQQAMKDSNTVAVIIRANSPGGSPVYSQMLYEEILRLRALYPKKPIYTVIEEICTSGCYYIAAATDKIYAAPASIIGSIGVIYPGFGFNRLMNKLGIDSRLLIAGKNKAMGYPFLPPNAAQITMQQNMLNKVHQQFILAVKNGRGSKLHHDDELFSGRFWVGADGVKLGLIDNISSVNTVARDVFKTDQIVDFTTNDDSVKKIIKKFKTYTQGLMLNSYNMY